MNPMKIRLLWLFVITAGWPALTARALAAATSDNPTNDVIIESSQARDDWSFDVVPYLWIAGYDGSFSVPGVPAGLPRRQTTTVDPFTTHISGAAMLAARMRYRDVGLYFDGAWLQLKTDGGTPSGLYSGTEIKSDIAFGAIEGLYRLPGTGKFEVDVMGGARVWYAGNEIHFNAGTSPAFTTDDSRTWCDPIVGAHARYDFNRHWFGLVLGDVGGFGVGSDLEWNVFGGVGYRFSDWCSATLGYRYLHMDYSNDGFLMDVNVQGFLVGVGFHF
jgi:opacity protein-like surface antigen